MLHTFVPHSFIPSFILGQIPTTVYTADEVVSPYIYVFYVAFIVRPDQDRLVAAAADRPRAASPHEPHL